MSDPQPDPSLIQFAQFQNWCYEHGLSGPAREQVFQDHLDALVRYVQIELIPGETDPQQLRQLYELVHACESRRRGYWTMFKAYFAPNGLPDLVELFWPVLASELEGMSHPLPN